MVGQVWVVLLVVKAVRKDCRTAGVGCTMAGLVECRTSGVAGYTLHVHIHAVQKIECAYHTK